MPRYFSLSPNPIKCPYCGKGNVFFGDTYPNPKCNRVIRDNTQSMDQFWGEGNTRRERRKSFDGPFFSPSWAIPFKLPWWPVRLVW